MASVSTPAAQQDIFREADVYLRQAFFFEPKYENTYMRTLKKLPNFRSILGQLGMATTANFKTMSIITLEEDQRSDMVTLNAQAVVPAPGANITVTINGPYDDVGDCMAKERYVVFLPINGGMNGRVVSITPTAFAYSVVLAPMSGPWPAIPAGTNMLFVGSSVGSGSTALNYFYKKGLTAYEHRMQAMRLDTKIYDFALIADQNGRITTYNATMPTPWKGGTTKCWTQHEVSEWAEQFDRDINYSLLVADRDRLTVRSADGPSYMMGLFPAIRYGGGNNMVTPATFSATTFQNAATALRDSNTDGGSSRTVLVGETWQNKFDDWVNTQTQNGNRPQHDLDNYVYGCNSIRNISGMDWKMVTCNDFNDPLSLGAMGFRNKAVGIPTNMTRQMSDNKMVPLFEMKYVEAPLGIEGAPNGMVNYTYQRGPGLAPNGAEVTTTNGEASLSCFATAKVGTVIRGLEAFIMWE